MKEPVYRQSINIAMTAMVPVN